MSLVTVIIPFCNNARYLDAAIRSVVGQTHVHIELVLVDDGSCDGSAVVAQRHAPPARYIRRENGGAGAARNTGVDGSSGEFIAFCDADDIWMPTKLERQLAVFGQDPGVNAVFTGVREFEETERPPGSRRRPRERVPGALPSALLIRRSAFEQVGRFAEDLRIGEWADWYVRMRESGLREHWLSEVLVARRLHGENASFLRPEARIEYSRILRAHLRRRRAGRSGA
jgi:glycosyltransferase involved in cell wall biosynthesis